MASNTTSSENNLLIDEFLCKLPQTEKSTSDANDGNEYYHISRNNATVALYRKYIENPSRKTLAACITYPQYNETQFIKDARPELVRYVLNDLPDESPYLQKK